MRKAMDSSRGQGAKRSDIAWYPHYPQPRYRCDGLSPGFEIPGLKFGLRPGKRSCLCA